MASLDADIRRKAAQVGAATRWGHLDEAAEHQRDLAELRIAAAIREITADAVPLLPEQVARLTALLEESCRPTPESGSPATSSTPPSAPGPSGAPA